MSVFRYGTAKPIFPETVPPQMRGGRARGRVPPGHMNSLERDYAAHLEFRRIAEEVVWWRFNCVKLRLAVDTFYEPDFMVMLPGGELEIHEVKGHWEDDARVKIKVAAAIFPFRFVAITRPKGREPFVLEEISA